MTRNNDEGMLDTNQSYAGRFLTIPQVAKLLRVEGATVRKWIKDGTIEAVELPAKPGSQRKHRRVRGEVVDKLLGNA